MNNSAITIFEPQNFGIIIKNAPQAFKENSLSHDRCIEFGKILLERVITEGMNDILDKEIADYIEKAKKTVKKMNGKRCSVTQLFDSIRSAYTTLENEVDPTKKDTVPAQLQAHRNAFAAKKREEYELELRQRQLQQEKASQTEKYTQSVEEAIRKQINAKISGVCNKMLSLESSVTLENYEEVFESIRLTSSTEIKNSYFRITPAPTFYPTMLNHPETRAIEDNVKAKNEEYMHQSCKQIEDLRDEILDRLPSKRKELEKIALASKEEAERIKKELEEKERAAAEQYEKERAEREAKERAAAELAAQKQEMESLFGAAEVQANQYQPKTSVKKRINILHPDGFMQVLGMWWAQCGCTLSVQELEKMFAKQITFCNKIANDKDNPILIVSENVEYVDEVKAK